MKKSYIKLFKRLTFGIILSIGIGYIITLAFSIFYGKFLPATPLLVEKYGELKAAEMLAFYSALIGISFTITEPVWNFENWSLFKSTTVYFLINITVMLFSGWKMMWFEISTLGIFIYILVYTVIFLIIWIIEYMITKKEAEKLNSKIKNL